MSTLRIMLVGPLPPPSGGMANQTRQLAALLRAEGLEVQVVQTNAPYRPQWIEKVPILRAVFRMVPYLFSLWKEAGRSSVAHVMANSGLAWFLFAAPAIHISHWRGLRVVVNYRGGLAREFLASKSGLILASLKRAQLLVVPSGFLRAVFSAHGVDAQIIPNIVNVEMFAPANNSQFATAAPHIVVARNLEAIYGIDVAIKAAEILKSRLPAFRMTIAGSGIEREVLESQVTAAGLGDSVRFTGRLEVAEMAALYREADVVLNPSRVDNTPNSILEALACGVPVVSTNVGGISYLVENERTAILVAPDEPDAIAVAVIRTLNDADLRKRLRTEGLKLAHACSWPKVKEQWLESYRRLAMPIQ